MRAFRALCLAALLGAAAISGPPATARNALLAGQPVADCRADTVQVLAGDAEPIRITVEVAATPAARAQGLMHRRHLPPRSGMLFVYEHPQPVAFWMRNTLIPLDMLFIDSEGVIRHIHAGAVPHDETAIPGHSAGDPDPDRLLVLEIGGGEAAGLGIREGMAIAHPALPAATARHPCD